MKMKKLDYDASNIHEVYDTARSLAPATLAVWLDALADVVSHPVTRILDVGCGTGRFSNALAKKFNASVWGVDPSSKALTVAQDRAEGNLSVRYRRGQAERLPIDESIDLVFLSMVYHHLDDPAQALSEMSRVLNRPGSLAIRTATKEDIEFNRLFSFFPSAKRLELGRMPTYQGLIDTVTARGFTIAKTTTLHQHFADTYSTYFEKVAQRGLSALRMIDNVDFSTGLKRLRRYCATRGKAGPVTERFHLFVFERR